MIKSIILDNLNPKAFAGAPPEGAPSRVFNSNVVFSRGKSYLIEAGSGRGTSSFCSFLCGLRNDYCGSISFEADGAGGLLFEPHFVELRRCSLAVMFQDSRLFPEFTALENIMLKSRLTDYWNESEVVEMLGRVGLASYIDKPCATLSLGQQQRVAFVRALAQPCDFILLDEPVSHLDSDNALLVADVLRERQSRDGVGVIVTSVGYRLPYEYDEVLEL